MLNTQTAKKPNLGRPRNPEKPKLLALQMPRELHAKIRAQANTDGMELCPWIRLACLEFLRRRKRLAA
ncbi:MAG TPA: hypothetical protein VGI46_06885 [Candidatus Acidoferrum sp.]|jgi:hypothetical protein